MNLIADLAAPGPGALSLFFFGMALVVAGVRRKQTAELALAVAAAAPPAKLPRG